MKDTIYKFHTCEEKLINLNKDSIVKCYCDARIVGTVLILLFEENKSHISFSSVENLKQIAKTTAEFHMFTIIKWIEDHQDKIPILIVIIKTSRISLHFLQII